MLHRSDLLRIVSALSDAFADTLEDELPLGFSGGCAILDGDRIIFEPECCGDLAALDEWEAAAAYRAATPAQLWIGHPSLEMRFVPPDLALRVSPATDSDSPPEYLVDPSRLLECAATARGIQLAFSVRLATVLRELGIARAEDFARPLAGIGSSSHAGAG